MQGHIGPSIPSRDGDSATFDEYEQLARWYAEGLPSRGEEKAAPRLAGALKGEAWRALEELTREDVVVGVPLPRATELMTNYL